MENLDSLIGTIVSVAIALVALLKTWRRLSVDIAAAEERALAEMSRRLVEATQGISTLTQVVADADARIVILESDNAHFKNDVARLTAENDALRAQVTALQAAVDALRRQNQELRNGIGLLVEQIRQCGVEPVWTPPDGEV